jgi:hypothetical protein
MLLTLKSNHLKEHCKIVSGFDFSRDEPQKHPHFKVAGLLFGTPNQVSYLSDFTGPKSNGFFVSCL